MNARNWSIKRADEAAAQHICRTFTLNPVVAAVLAARGFSDDRYTAQFLNSDLNDLTPPCTMKGMEPCAQRISDAVNRGERILIYGDYDVDGITATSILMRLFRTCGIKAEYIIPDRIEDGYGMNIESAQNIISRKSSLVITVDCGISAQEPVNILRAQGIDVIITDHHLPGESLPDTPFIVDPALDPGSPCESLSGAGIAFKAAWAAAQKITGAEKVSPSFRKFLVSALPLAALGTVADIVPLTGENRILVSSGLPLISLRSPIKGLRALMRAAGLNGDKQVTAFDIGFRIGPRLNAAGRMDSASKCVRLLTTESDEESEHIACQLEGFNRERRNLCRQTMKDAVCRIEKEIDTSSCSTIVAGHPKWHRGILGIIASRIAERYNRPSVILCKDEKQPDIWHASARSVPRFHITNALRECAPLLLQFGGHEGAAGLSLMDSHVNTFKEEFEKTVSRLFPEQGSALPVEIDAVAEQKHLDITLAKDMQKLGPFGEGNKRPLILARGLKIARSPRLVGSEDKHLKISFITGPGSLVDAIGFNMGNRIREIIDTDTVDLVFFPAVNEWKGRVSLDLQIKDIKEH